MRNRYIFLADLVLISLCAFGAFVLRFDWYFEPYRPGFEFFLVAALITKPPVFFAFGLYRRFWRYASVHDMLGVSLAVSAGSIVLATLSLGALWLRLVPVLPRSVVVIDWLLTLLCIGGVRLSVRVVAEALDRERPGNGEQQRRVLIVGAGDAGTMIVREIARNPQLGMVAVGFVDDHVAKIGKRIHGVPVLGPLSRLGPLVTGNGVDEVIIAMPTAPGTVVRAVAEVCREAGVAARSMPGVFELLDGHVSVSRLRSVDINDLLRRSPIGSVGGSASYLRDRVVLVTGAGGSIGSELCRQAARSGARAIVLVGHGENSIYEAEASLRHQCAEVQLVPVIADIRDARRLTAVFGTHRPDVVFHAAAHKHVPLMERNSPEAVSNNVEGTLNVVTAAEQFGVARFVLVSTDKAVLPSSVMGASKRVAELIVTDAAARLSRPFTVVRFGNVLGSRGSVVPRFNQQIARGGPVTVTHPAMTRFFMTIPEAVHLVIQAAGLSHGGEVFVLRMGDPVRITDLAKDLIRLSGLSEEDVPIVFTGLRQGEKLHEGLWESGAVVEDTVNPDVVRVTERSQLSHDELMAHIGRLRRACLDGDDLAVREALANAVPTFVPAWPEGSPETVRPS